MDVMGWMTDAMALTGRPLPWNVDVGVQVVAKETITPGRSTIQLRLSGVVACSSVSFALLLRSLDPANTGTAGRAPQGQLLSAARAAACLPRTTN
jgi:hypothetical protein